ncbi:MAG: SET domain-containing protein [Candidatus Obscuribacterales bacterium]|nr:SET domain-containing protein [Candidatus Obscuribacterales bacterium]
MMLVKTKLGPSSIHGIGLFADQFIAAGTATWRFIPGFDIQKNATEIEVLSLPAREWFKQYAYLDFHVNVFVLCADDARFMNHSNNPNVRPDYEQDPFGLDIAACDIQIGEELTTNYTLFEKEDVSFK